MASQGLLSFRNVSSTMLKSLHLKMRSFLIYRLQESTEGLKHVKEIQRISQKSLEVISNNPRPQVKFFWDHLSASGSFSMTDTLPTCNSYAMRIIHYAYYRFLRRNSSKNGSIIPYFPLPVRLIIPLNKSDLTDLPTFVFVSFEYRLSEEEKQQGHILNINYSRPDLANFSFQSFIPCYLFGDFIISHGNGGAPLFSHIQENLLVKPRE